MAGSRSRDARSREALNTAGWAALAPITCSITGTSWHSRRFCSAAHGHPTSLSHLRDLPRARMVSLFGSASPPPPFLPSPMLWWGSHRLAGAYSFGAAPSAPPHCLMLLSGAAHTGSPRGCSAHRHCFRLCSVLACICTSCARLPPSSGGLHTSTPSRLAACCSHPGFRPT